MNDQPGTLDNRDHAWSGRLLVVGASGFLGSNIVTAHPPDEVIVHSSASSDLAVAGSGYQLVVSSGADTVINCAALADVDACERLPGEASRLNADLPGELASACADLGKTLVHISTDAVFGGAPGPYSSDTEPSPLNVYGRTKLEGEQAVLDAASSALIVRTNIVGWSPSRKRSLLEFFLNRLRDGKTVNGFTDVWFRPVAASSVWPIVARLLSDGATGVIHATGAELISKYDFGRRVAEEFGFSAELVLPTSIADLGLDAVRANRMDVTPSIDDPPTLQQTLELLHRNEPAWRS